MTALPLPFFEVTNWARLIVPSAPGIFVIGIREAYRPAEAVLG